MKNKKRKIIKNCTNCSECVYIGDGDFACMARSCLGRATKLLNASILGVLKLQNTLAKNARSVLTAAVNLQSEQLKR